MKKILNIFFVTLGVIFFILILIGTYFFVVDPLNLRGFYSGNTSGTDSSHPYINESQESALKTFGIDPASLPSEITPEQEACFESKLGEERVAEIKSGDSPTATDYFKAKDCI
ncbi:MAG: hypothetical protein WD605_02980 [Candidatus Paceibacterota bacterium]